MKHVVAGRKNQKISVYKPIQGKTASGAQLHNKFQKVASPWASVITKQTSEQEAGNALQNKVVYSIAMSWRDISSDWVVLWRDQVLRVSSIDDSDPQRRQKILLAGAENNSSKSDFLSNSVVA